MLFVLLHGLEAPRCRLMVVEAPGMEFLPYLLSNSTTLIFLFISALDFTWICQNMSINWCNVIAKAQKHWSCLLFKENIAYIGKGVGLVWVARQSRHNLVWIWNYFFKKHTSQVLLTSKWIERSSKIQLFALKNVYKQHGITEGIGQFPQETENITNLGSQTACSGLDSWTGCQPL